MSRGQPRDVIRAAANQAVRDAIFLVELVLEINAAAADLVQTADLRVTALAWQLRALQAEASRTPKAAATAGWRAWRDDVAGPPCYEYIPALGTVTIAPAASSGDEGRR